MKNLKGFAFVGNPVNVDCKVPFNISDHLIFSRATAYQRRDIKRYLAFLGGRANSSPFECSTDAIPLPEFEKDGFEAFAYTHKRLPSQRWRYYVVTFQDVPVSLEQGCTEINLLRASSQLTRHPLRLNPVFFAGSRRSDFTSDWEFFSRIAASGGEVYTLDRESLLNLRNCYEKVTSLQTTHPDIARAIRMFNDLPDRSGHNELTTLGLFSVLEFLFTHSPRGDYDSISHQIRTKVVLVNRRLPEPIDYSNFREANSETIWNKLYDLRSRIAHGGQIDFDKKLAVLHDTYTVEQFLKKILRSVLRAASEEPDLYLDLKAI